MPGKRGRPITIQDNDPAIIRRREKTAERVRRYLERKRAERDNATKTVEAHTAQDASNITATPMETERPASVVTLHSSASPSPQVSGRPRDQVTINARLGEQDDDENALQNAHGVDTRDTHAIQNVRASSLNLEENAVCKSNAEHVGEFTHRYNEPERQGCDVDIETLMQSGQDEQAHLFKQQSLLRRRHLAALRQRRFRDRQRTLQGLPPVIRKKNHQHREILIDSATSIDDLSETLVPMQSDNRISKGQRPRLSHDHATIVASRARTSQQRPDRPYVANDEAQRLETTAACASNPQPCQCETSTYISRPPTSGNVGANTENPSVRGAQAENTRERGRGGILNTGTSVFSDENQRYQSACSTSVDDESLLNGPVEPSAQRATAKKLCEQMLYGLQSCSIGRHERQLDGHTEAAGNNHFALDQISNEPSFPSVLGLPNMVSKDDLNNSQTQNGSRWNAMFCGVSDSDSQSTLPVKNVCLHEEQTQPTNPNVSFDVDSFLGFATSLGVARKGLLYQPSPQAQQNLSSDVHFGLDISDTSPNSGGTTRSSFAMLRDVPHLFLGRLEGAENVTMHVFLPHLEVSRGTSVLTAAQLTRWCDKILHPAIYKYLPAHFTQHLPAGYQHALANSKARQIEARKIKTTSYQSQQSISYRLPPEYLAKIWEDVQEIIACTPGLHDFRQAQLEVFPDSCTSLARAHCFHIMTITFAALHLDVNTFARSAK